MVKKNVGIFLFECLPHTQTFIYEAVNNLQNFQPHILTKVFSKNSQYNFRHHIVNHQYRATFLTDIFLSYLKPRYFHNKILKKILNIGEHYSEYIKKNNIQLLHSHFALDGLYALSLGLKCKIPCIVSLHGGYDTKVILNMPGFPKKDFFKNVGLFIVPCEHSKKNLIFNGCPQEKISVLPHGIRTINIKQSKIERSKSLIKLLLVGRITEKKGILDTVNAFAKLRNKHRNIRLTIITGQRRKASDLVKEELACIGLKFPFNSQIGYEKKIQERIKRLNCERVITIIRRLPYDRVRQTMTEHDIFILPSKTASDGDEEGMPLALLEAQASGLPVVTTSHAGNSEAVINGKTGFVIPEGDIEAIIRRLEMLIENRQMRITMGREGQKFINTHFKMTKHIYHLENIYNELIK